ncbi:Ig-like domain-containing protein [Lachnoclostridium phytofermentans]|uniref:Ig domain protein group 2 domain protein n=1 Tax=Lachnoclostridium phytofermentans (strain ATCC 700394 / DSM 18823 / ISDg) TaxID=357809 RepID=A9KI11_LACP7|nr:Ig-like domain-containing protein [Lachnoclostridium phytofermentans]ABX43858.1 Ig domain protein group 2 domain protein [Lachnoclostridium phytofermentans ISDg]
MKNFFKKLAFVLALAMVVLAIAPAANASAATAPTLNTTGKKLYLEKDVATGNYKDYFTLKVWNKGDYKVTFKSMNPTIATIHSTNGTVKAKAVGEALLKATVTNTKTGKVVKNLECKVWVKRNAVESGVSTASAAKLDNVLAIGDKVKLNIYRKAITGQVAWQQADKTIVTDYTVWSSSNTKVATVDKWGTVKAVGAGTATITVKTLQTENTAVPTTKETKLTVTVAEPFSVTSVKVDTLKLTLGTGIESLSADAIVIKDAKTQTRSYVKNVTLSADKKTAEVELFNPLVNGNIYTVEVSTNGKVLKDEIEFKTGKVTKIEVVDQIIPANKETAIQYKVYDEFGLDVTAVTNVSFNDNLGINSNKLTLDNGVIAYCTISYVNPTTAEVITSGQFKITAKSSTVTSIIGHTLSTQENVANETFKETNTSLSLSDANKYYLYLQQVDQYNNKAGIIADSYTSLTPEVLVVSSNGLVTPVKEGTGLVSVKVGDLTQTISITVTAARKATAIKTTVNDGSMTEITQSTENPLAANNKPSIKVEILDQNGKILENANGTANLTVISGSNLGFSNTTLNIVNGVGTLEINPTTYGTAVVKVEYGTLNFALSNVTVRKADTIATGYKIFGAANLDVKDCYEKNESINLGLYSVNASGDYIADARTTISDASKIEFKVNNASGTTVKTVTGGTLALRTSDLKDATGTYTIVASSNGQVVATTQITVTDSSTKPVLTLVKNSAISNGTISTEDIKDCLNFDKSSYTIVGVKFVSNNTEVASKSTYSLLDTTSISETTTLYNVGVQIKDANNRIYTYENIGHITFTR